MFNVDIFLHKFNIDAKYAHATAVYVVFIPVCRKYVYIDEANQGTNTFQEVKHH